MQIKKRILKFLFLSFVLFFIISSCQYFSLLSNNEWKDLSRGSDDEVDVYIAGYYGATVIPCYWKNGERIDIEHSAAYSTYARSMDIEGDDIYFGGNIYDGSSHYPVYWKNGKMYSAERPASSIIYSIKVSGGAVYSAGDCNTASPTAAYWINDKIYLTNSPSATSGARSIFVDKSTMDFYVGGYHGPGITTGYACYWENGKNRVELSPALGGVVNSIQVYNGNVYASGRYNNSTTTLGYWMNHNFQTLTPALIINSSFFYQGDIYATGYYSGNIAICWKNTLSITLQGSTSVSDGESIFVYNNDVYVSGHNNSNYAVYWKNGVMATLDAPSTPAYASAIIVKPKRQ